MNLNYTVVEIISKQLDVDAGQVTMETLIEGDLGADELQVIELIMVIEEEFGVKIPDDDFPRLKNVGGLIEYISDRKDGVE